MSLRARLRRRVEQDLRSARVLIDGDAEALITGIRRVIAPDQLVLPGDGDRRADLGVVIIDRKAHGSTLHRAQEFFSGIDAQLADDAPRICLIVGGANSVAPRTLARLLSAEVVHQIVVSTAPSLATTRDRADRRRLRALGWLGIDILRLGRV